MTEALHQQIADDLRAQIESGQLAPGQELKPEAELRAEYARILSQPISSKAVRDAITLLTSVGLIEIRHGGETVVVEKIDLAQNRTADESQGGGTADFLSEGIGADRELEATILCVEVHSADAAPELELSEGAQVISRHGERSIDGQPYSIQTSFHPVEFAIQGATDLLQPSPIQDGAGAYIRATLGINQSGYRDTILVRTADKTEAEYFGFPAKSDGLVVEARRTAFDDDSHPIGLTVSIYAAGRNHLVWELGRTPTRAALSSPAASAGCEQPSARNGDQRMPILHKDVPRGRKSRIRMPVKLRSWLDKPAKPSRLQIYLMIGLVLPQIHEWLSFPALQKSDARGLSTIVVSIVLIVTSVGLLLAIRNTAAGIILGLTYMFLTLTYMFSALYWGYSSASNFSIPLSRLDAIYFTIGTLSTAGTGNISATSELTRGLQSMQMICDFVIVVFAVALVIPRLIEYAKARDMTNK